MVYRRLNKNEAPPKGETQARIRGFLNERHRRILRDFPQLRDDVLSIVSVEDQDRSAVPEEGIARMTRIWDSTNRRRLEQRSLQWLRTADPVPDTGTPCVWAPISQTQVHTQPEDASELFVISTDANDVCRCYVEGIVSDNTRRRVEVTLTGTTGVSIDATIIDWIEIDKFYIAEEAAGSVSLLEDSDVGTELALITPGTTSASYLSFLLWPTPAAVVNYDIDVTRGVMDMANPTDTPLLPLDFHDLLAIGARLDEYEHTDDSRRRIAEVEWDEGVKALTSWIVAHPDTRIDLNAERRLERSTLGPWFPRDTY